jgi:hypothetical protein
MIVPGKPTDGADTTSAQIVGRSPNGKPIFRAMPTGEAQASNKRVTAIGLAAVAIARWTVPDYLRVDMWLCNLGRITRTRVLKEIHDPLQGIVFAHDSRILDGRTIRVKDAGGPRVILHIRAVDGRRYGFRKPAKSRAVSA